MTSSASPPSCPFCTIASTNPPIPPLSLSPSSSSSSSSVSFSVPLQFKDYDTSEPGSAHLILSTEHVLAFLDIMPLTRGHVLVAPRRHLETLGDVDVRVGQEMGKWLPILSRVMTRTIFGADAESHWNVVQNNGVRAAQQVPHVHFHIIPRPATDGAIKPSFAMFGRGQRDELDDDEGTGLARSMRRELALEVERVQRDEGVDLTQVPGDPRQRGKL